MCPPGAVLSTFWPRWPSQFRATAGQKVVPWRNGHATHPAARIGLSTGRGRLVPLLAFLSHDSRCTPCGLTTRAPKTTPPRGCYRRAKTVPPAVTTSPSIGVHAKECSTPPHAGLLVNSSDPCCWEGERGGGIALMTWSDGPDGLAPLGMAWAVCAAPARASGPAADPSTWRMSRVGGGRRGGVRGGQGARGGHSVTK